MKKAAERSAGREGRASRLLTALTILLAAAGALLIAYPSLSNWENGLQARRAIALYDRAVTETDDAAIEKELEAARAYNASILERAEPLVPEEGELSRYNALLDLSGDGLMGTIRIPSLGIELPFYHGTNETVLKRAVGHIEWSSLPVGGESTHCVLSAHRGLPSARLFTDLDKLREGDRFTVTVLGRTIGYEVDRILVTLPEEVRELEIVPGEDYCTLVTCTPYGVNTHRLLVRGRRAELEAAEESAAEARETPAALRIAKIAIPLLFVSLLVTLLLYGREKPGRRERAARKSKSE